MFANTYCPQIEEYLKYSIRKQGFLTFFFNFDDFSKFVSIGGNLSAKTQQFCLEKDLIF